MVRRGRSLLCILLVLTAAAVASSQALPDFSGLWKQDNDRCQPKKKGNVTLRIEHHDPQLTIETSISNDSSVSRRAVQKYKIGGEVAVSTGADGDEFHTSVAWSGQGLVFSIEEHEHGHTLQSKEIWSVIEEGRTLERIRERPDGMRQILFFHSVQ